jgi:hypothetical protein
MKLIQMTIANILLHRCPAYHCQLQISDGVEQAFTIKTAVEVPANFSQN